MGDKKKIMQTDEVLFRAGDIIKIICMKNSRRCCCIMRVSGIHTATRSSLKRNEETGLDEVVHIEKQQFKFTGLWGSEKAQSMGVPIRPTSRACNYRGASSLFNTKSFVSRFTVNREAGRLVPTAFFLGRYPRKTIEVVCKDKIVHEILSDAEEERRDIMP